MKAQELQKSLRQSYPFIEMFFPLLAFMLVFGVYYWFTLAFMECDQKSLVACHPFIVLNDLRSSGICCLTPGAAVYSGRVVWTFMSGLNFVGCLAVLIVGVYLIWKSLADLAGNLWGIVFILASLLFAVGVAYCLAPGNMNQLVSCRDDSLITPTAKPMVLQLLACTTSVEVLSVVPFTWWTISVSIVAAIFLALASCAILWPINEGSVEQKALKIARRLRYLRTLLYTGTFALVVGVFRLSASFSWVMAYVSSTGNKSLTESIASLTSAATTAEAASYTLFLATVYLPSVFVLRGRAMALMSHQDSISQPAQEAWLQKQGLAVSLSNYLPRIAAIIAPLLAGAVGDLIKTLAK